MEVVKGEEEEEAVRQVSATEEKDTTDNIIEQEAERHAHEVEAEK